MQVAEESYPLLYKADATGKMHFALYKASKKITLFNIEKGIFKNFWNLIQFISL